MITFRDTDAPLIESPFHSLLKRKKRREHSISQVAVVRFIKDLSTLINAAVPLVKSLEVLARQQKDKAFGVLVNNLAISVHSGVPFSTSLMKYPKVFDVLFISMVKAGEASCSLGEVLQRIAIHKENELKLKKKIQSIMIYPLIVIGIALLIVLLLFLFIIPKFESVFNTALNETVLPLATRIIISVSHSFQEIAVSLMIVLIIVFSIVKFMKKGIKDSMILKISVIGNIIRDINIALFSRILGTLIANGVPLLEALKVSENIPTNYTIKSSLKETRKKVEDGETLSTSLQSESNFPEMVIGMIHVGEETGTLSNMLLEIANKLDEDIKLALEGLTSILEPMMTLLLALIIGSIVIALFLPIVNVMNNIVSF